MQQVGTWGWTQQTSTFTTPANTYYLNMSIILNNAAGSAYFDDVTLTDLTSGNSGVRVSNGDFESNPVNYDSALDVLDDGQDIGCFSLPGGTVTRQIQRPFIDSNCGLYWNENSVSGDDARLTLDTNGIWYRKFIWAQLNPHGVYSWYYWNTNIMVNGLYKYTKAQQAFLSGIPLSNGNYSDAQAAVVDSTGNTSAKIRAWGQKDLTNYRCHLWIDHKDSYWYNVVVNSAAVAQVTGNVSVNMQDTQSGSTYTVEFFDTQTGLPVQAMNSTLTGVAPVSGVITFPVTLAADGTNITGNYQVNSDVAVKIYRNVANIAVNLTVPSTNVTPGQQVTVTVAFTNNGGSPATNVAVSAGVPSTMTYVAGSASGAGTYDSTNNVVDWVVPSMGAGQTVTETFMATVQ